MEKLLILLHTDDGRLCKQALEVITVGQSLKNQFQNGLEVVVGIVGNNIKEVAKNIARCGATAFLGIEGEEFSTARYTTDSLAIETIVKKVQPSLVIAPATIRWNKVVPGAMFRVNGITDTHITGITVQEGTLKVSRWFYRQRIEGIVHRTHRPWALLIESGVCPAFTAEPAEVQIELIDVQIPNTEINCNVIGLREPPVEQQTIRPDAKLLFVAGAGWTKKQADGKVHLEEAEKIILDFLQLTRASLGSSKSLVDMGSEGEAVLPFLSHMNQIGQTGSSPRHPKGLATCCHGEEPHTVGWRFINERRAINLDPNCGWARGKADVLYVADAFAVMKKVNELLASSQGK
ncbi:MAG: electron transfer flavoprotein subunit alpha/FixB family protein [Verrucomicrobiia bacterium]|jgi:electron transfer flavoprotein alpha subunit